MDSKVKHYAKALQRKDAQVNYLNQLSRLVAQGIDCSPAAPEIMRYCVITPATNTKSYPQILSISLDILTSSPAHSQWPSLIRILLTFIHPRRAPSPEITRIALSKLPLLPSSVLRCMLIKHTQVPALIHDAARTVQPVPIRRAAVRLALALVLRDRPLTEAPDRDDIAAVSVDAHSDILHEDQHDGKKTIHDLDTVRSALQVSALIAMDAIMDPDDGVAITAISRIVAFASSTPPIEAHTPLLSARIALGNALWVLLQSNIKKIADHVQNAKGVWKRDAFKAIARVALKALSFKKNQIDNDQTETFTSWARQWVDRSLMTSVIDASDSNLKITAALAALEIAHNADHELYFENKIMWSSKAVAALTRTLSSFTTSNQDLSQENGNSHASPSHLLPHRSAQIIRAILKSVTNMRQETGVSIKFLINETSQLIGLISSLPRQADRYEFFYLLFFTLISFDLKSPEATTLSSASSSSSFKRLMELAQENSTVPSDLVASVSMALVFHLPKLQAIEDKQHRKNTLDAWAAITGNWLLKASTCLRWPDSISSFYAKDSYLKLFECLGQYNSVISRFQGLSLEEYERVQELLIKNSLQEKYPRIRASLLTISTRYWIESGLKAEANVGHLLKVLWNHLQEDYKDLENSLDEAHTGLLWAPLGPDNTAIVKTSSTTLATDHVMSAAAAALALVQRNPRIAEKVHAILVHYLGILVRSRADDKVAEEIINTTLGAISVYFDTFFPKPVEPRILPTMGPNAREKQDPLLWILDAPDSCIFASSRLGDPQHEMQIVVIEEMLLRATSKTPSTDTHTSREGDNQTISGAADPFLVSMNHLTNIQKGIIRCRVTVTNRTKNLVENVTLFYSVGDSLVPLTDSVQFRELGIFSGPTTKTATFPVAIQKGDVGSGRVYLKLVIPYHNKAGEVEGITEQLCRAYYVPTSDVLLLQNPPHVAGLDVFRRRWDMLPSMIEFNVFIRENQSLDFLVEVLTRQLPLREVGRMRSTAHFSGLVGDSTRRNYVTVAVYAAEAMNRNGKGPCIATVSLRTSSKQFSEAFSDECQEWLKKGGYKVLYSKEENVAEKYQCRPQDSFFVRNSDQKTIHQRWRTAHPARLEY